MNETDERRLMLPKKNKNIDLTVILLLIISLILNYISVKSKEYSNKNIFCGTKQLPIGYGRYGSRYECLKKGYGAGFYGINNKYPFRKFGYILIIIVIGITIYKMK